MTLQQRDRRALIGLGVVTGLILIWYATSSSDSPSPQVVTAAESIPVAERRLTRLRQVAATVPGKQQILDQVTGELLLREAGLISAETAAQAQAKLAEILQRIGRAQTPPLDFRGVENGPVRPLGDHYGEVVLSVSFEGGIEQLVNLLADITAQKELIATNEIRLGQAHPKQKTLPVRLTVSGVVRRELVPQRKGPGAI
ncbi:MAG TPA: type II secretion system protein GspM [Bryobacteraceae bacterium]|nr:type II secretion system protein GspM [Bryobacteraceae bacterium]